MYKLKWCMGFLLIWLSSWNSFAQGPPITGDKPIMLGGNSWVIKTLTEIRNSNEGVFTKAPIMVHYLPSPNTLVGIHLPFVQYHFKNETRQQTLGDLEFLAKYQFYRKDKMGKTFRLVAKTLQTIPTGQDINIIGISTQKYQNYLGIVAGYESIKYGISNELGYNLSPSKQLNEWRYKLGFGLPLLKSTYPVNQINLYFEYQNSWFTEANDFLMLYSQGIQYAKGRNTFEVAIQLPIVQIIATENKRKFSLFLGTRYVF